MLQSGQSGTNIVEGLPSMRSKRFCGVREQRKSEKWDFRCFAHVKNGAKQH